jgi:hypothetical protein
MERPGKGGWTNSAKTFPARIHTSPDIVIPLRHGVFGRLLSFHLLPAL